MSLFSPVYTPAFVHRYLSPAAIMVNGWRGQYVPERPGSEHITNDGRFYEAEAIRNPPLIRPSAQGQVPLNLPQSISRALREQCQINHQGFFLAVLTESGEFAYFSGPQAMPHETASRMFMSSRFLQYQRRPAHGPATDASVFPFDDELFPRESSTLSTHRRLEHHNYNSAANQSDDDSRPVQRIRKRPRGSANRRRAEEVEDMPVVTRSKKGLRIGDAEEVGEFYALRFRNLQQNACKIVAKGWVRKFEPRKQTNHPYTKGDPMAPDWWPKPWGPGRDDRVPHKEPDHLLKKHRVNLLVHMLRLVTEPKESQHPDIRNFNLTVAALEADANETLSSFFSERGNNEKNLAKKPFLKELMKVARHEEQYKRGEIDAATEIFVMADGRVPDVSDIEDEGEPSPGHRHPRASSPSRTSTESTPTPTPTGSSHGPTANLQDPAFIGDIPLRGPQQYPSIAPDMTTGQHAYVENGNMTLDTQPPLSNHGPLHMQDMMSSSHDTSRRTSMYNNPPATDFQSPTTTGIYSSINAWQQGTAASGPSAIYSFPPHQQHSPLPPPPNLFSPTQGVPVSQGSQYLGGPFHGLPLPTDGYRNGHAGHHSAAQGPPYNGYLHHHQADPKEEPMNKGPHH